MEYEIGSLADLITGTVTPNRPKLSRKAFTPVKHKLSPNVTPRGSEALVGNDSFISPSVQKRKNIVKKSPKRIFENINSDLDSTQTENLNEFIEKTKLNLNAAISETLPKSEHLNCDTVTSKGEVEIKIEVDEEYETTKSNIKKNKRDSILSMTEQSITNRYNKTPNKNNKKKSDHNNSSLENSEKDAEISAPSSKQTRIHSSVHNIEEDFKMNTVKETSYKAEKESNKKKNKRKSDQMSKSYDSIESNTKMCIPSDLNKEKRVSIPNNSQEDLKLTLGKETIPKKKSKKKKKQNNSNSISVPVEKTGKDIKLSDKSDKKSKTEGRAAKRRARRIAALRRLSEKGIEIAKKIKSTAKSESLDNVDSSSEHDSDDELESETELEVKNILNNTEHQDESSDEDNNETTKMEEQQEVEIEDKDKEKVSEDQDEQMEEESKDKDVEVKKLKEHVVDETEAKRTLFVGNVPYSSKCKKELKKIFSPFGAIDTIRFRTIPTKDARLTPKLAVIKEEFHPDRDTVVNAYVKFRDMAHATLALAANNTKMGDFHIRVTQSEVSDVTRDSRAVLFVGNLPFDCEEEQLRSAFEKCGAIESVRIVRDRKTQIGKGFGYVNFKSADGVEIALGLSEEELKVKNRNVRIRRYLVAGTKNKNKNRPNNTSGPPNNQFGGTNNQSRPPNRFGGQNNRSGPPNNRFGAPNYQSGPPNRFGGQNYRSGHPNNHFGNQNHRFGGNERLTEPNSEVGEKKMTGAALRIQNKTQRSQGAVKRQRENDAGQIPKKRPPRDTPRDKKPAKEYLGVTAEKKKKKRISKTDKKKKKLSEILLK